jgi:hypothetical protein
VPNAKNVGVPILADGEIVLFVFRAADRTAGVSLTQIWIPISLTNSPDCRIFDAADLRCRGLPHEIEWQAGGGRYAQAHDPSLCFCGDRSLSLIPA